MGRAPRCATVRHGAHRLLSLYNQEPRVDLVVVIHSVCNTHRACATVRHGAHRSLVAFGHRNNLVSGSTWSSLALSNTNEEDTSDVPTSEHVDGELLSQVIPYA
jgi:hypothetical protein